MVTDELNNSLTLPERKSNVLKVAHIPRQPIVRGLLIYSAIASLVVDELQNYAIDTLNLRSNILIAAVYAPIVIFGLAVGWTRLLRSELRPALYLTILIALSLFWTNEVYWFGAMKAFGCIVTISIASLFLSDVTAFEFAHECFKPLILLAACVWAFLIPPASRFDLALFHIPPSFGILAALGVYLLARADKREKLRVFDLLFVAAVMYLLYRSYIRATILGGALMLLIGTWRRRNLNAWIIQIVLLISVVIVAGKLYRTNPLDVETSVREDVLGRLSAVRSDNLSHRLELWTRLWDSVDDYGFPPLMGVGIGDVDSEIWNRTMLVVGPQDSSGIKKSHSHNSLIEVYVGTGIVGVVLVFWLLAQYIRVLRMCRKPQILGVFAGYCFVAMANLAVFEPRGGYLFSGIFLAALGIGQRQIEDDSQLND